MLGKIIIIILFLGVCVYKGKPYREGQKWDDGCDFRCECMDGSNGQYRCNYRSVSFM